MGAVKMASRCVVWVYEKPDTSTFRYRVYNMVEALRAAGYAATWCRVNELEALLNKLDSIATLVLARVRYDAMVAMLIVAARSRGVRVIFDCDDLVFDIRYIHLLLDTLDQDMQSTATFDQWFSYVGRLEATARLCDAGIATNRFLARQLAQVVSGPIRVVPNFLNRRQQEVSDRLISEKRARGFRSEAPILIGYFSGTPSHRRDFAVAIPALTRALKGDPQVRLRIVGFLDDLGPLVEFVDQIERVPLLNWVALQHAIAEVDINIAPLQDNIFTNCKSELKYFEAAAVGTWTIASPTGPFRDAMGMTQDRPPLGRLSRAEDWDGAIEDAVHLVRDPMRYAAAANVAGDQIRDSYGWDRYTNLIREATSDA